MQALWPAGSFGCFAGPSGRRSRSSEAISAQGAVPKPQKLRGRPAYLCQLDLALHGPHLLLQAWQRGCALHILHNAWNGKILPLTAPATKKEPATSAGTTRRGRHKRVDGDGPPVLGHTYVLL